MAAFAFQVPSDVTSSLASVRSDKDPADYVVIGWDTPDSLKVLSTGVGGLEGMTAAFPEKDVAYALLRQNFTWESVGDVQADTVKFIFVYWFPDSGVPLMRKMKVGTHEGGIRQLFAQYHCDVNAGNLGEITPEIVNTMLENITGKANHQVAAREKKVEEKFERKFIGGMDGKTQAIDIVDEGALKEAIAKVRDNDQPGFDFCLADFDTSGKKPALKLKEVGGGGLDALKAALAADSFNYGIVRITETIDATEAVKFCYVKSQPEATPFRQKGKLGLLAGAVSAVFAPYHGDVFCDTVDELKIEDVVLATKKR